MATKTLKNPISTEWSERIVHAFALYTNATITNREEGRISLHVPFLIKVGKNEMNGAADVDFGPNDFGLQPRKGAENLTDTEIGRNLFAMLCDHIVNTNKDSKGKPFTNLKKLSIKTGYGDVYTWNGKSGEVKDAPVKIKK